MDNSDSSTAQVNPHTENDLAKENIKEVRKKTRKF